MIGPGGYLGALGHGILAEHCGTVGSVLLACGGCLLGLLLCTDYVLFQLAALTAHDAPRKRPCGAAGRATTPNDLDEEAHVGPHRRQTHRQRLGVG